MPVSVGTNNYPTKEEILASPSSIGVGDDDEYAHIYLAEMLRDWRVWEWKRADNTLAKFTALQHLIDKIAIELGAIEPHETIPLLVGPDLVDRVVAREDGTQYIELNMNKLSIITTLHELYHYLYGGSELEACRFSVWLFREAFPKAYARLVWDGHMLVRPAT